MGINMSVAALMVAGGPVYTACLEKSAIRENILSLQDKLAEMPQIECPLKHHFTEGAYAREILLPADSYVIGKIHRHAHINVISQGECYVLTEEGIKHLKAPLTFVSLPETKRVVYAVTDVVWTTVHATNETDLAKIEEYVISPTYNDLDPNLLIEVIK
jgi:hypothetical protein